MFLTSIRIKFLWLFALLVPSSSNPFSVNHTDTTMSKTVTVKIVSDVACPFCYIGLRHLEAASEASGVKVNLEWLPFLLNPHMSDEGEEFAKYYLGKYGPGAQATFLDPNSRLKVMGRQAGIEFTNNRRILNSRRAHALVELIKNKHGVEKANELMVDFYKSYFENGENINDKALLWEKVKDYGVGKDEADVAMAEPNLIGIMKQDESNKRMYGVSGVPYFMIHPNDGGEPVTFSGAYPPEMIAEHLIQAAK